MLPMTLLATAIQADREREFRNRRPRTAGVPSGLRHPRRPDVQAVVEGPRQRAGAASIGKPAVAGSR
jgi:hypothetical protein